MGMGVGASKAEYLSGTNTNSTGCMQAPVMGVGLGAALEAR